MIALDILYRNYEKRGEELLLPKSEFI